ncbi:hypothetical protein VP01_3347g2 [Puccinia sorghi]|uniref:HAT C-terminal dimerisation domain-containing protein n=1 Tax=Puccinia sorghi TaxID=27349 RepID=A0A0L6UX09_9BASI|nr:hypothetical protein VP01_3347g2 [Puccinia sorghi]
MATLLHPAFCLRFFAHCWPESKQHSQLLLEKNFNKQEAQLKKGQDDIKELEKDTLKVDNNNIVEFFNAPPNSAERRELEVLYHLNMVKVMLFILTIYKSFGADSFLFLHYRTIQRHFLSYCLAKDYLASSESSCEQMFSSEANVCSSGHGSLKPRKIERFVSSHMWLKQGIQVTGKFDKAQNIFKNYIDFSQKTSKK